MTEALKHEDTAAEALMGEIVDEFLNRVDRGERPEADEYIRRYPQLATVLRQMLPALRLLRASAADRSAGAADSAEPIAPEGPLGDYRLVREVGRGGMGVVYEAVQISLGRRVAVKVLPFASALDAKQLQRFKNEAQAAAQLHHTSIVPVHGVGCDRGVHYYAMQFIEGQTLAALIQDLRRLAGLEKTDETASTGTAESLAGALASGRWAPGKRSSADPQPTGPYTPPGIGPQAPAADTTTLAAAAVSTEHSTRNPAFFRTAANLGARAAEALEHAHGEGVIHRDIKPANLMVDGKGNLWITDFGLAHCQSQAGLTMTGDLVGTLRYMSPEQALAQRVVIDHRTDIYSLGATLYELLTLQPVFSGRDRQELLRQIAFEEPRPPRRLNKAIPAELETIVLKALEKNPVDRYATAQELADDLERFLNDEPIQAKRPSPLQRARKWTRRHKTVAWSATVATVLVLIVAVTALAVSNRAIAQEKKQTEEALRAETDAKNDLVQALQREERTAYFRRIALAERELATGNAGHAEELLDDCPLGLQGWEWHHLKRRRYGEPLTFRGHKAWIIGVAFSPDGKRIASASSLFSNTIGEIKIWDRATGKELLPPILGHVGPVVGVAYSPDGKTLASAGWDKTVQLWDAATGKYLRTLPGHGSYISSVAFSPDSKVVASASGDNTAKLWDAATGQLLATLRGHSRALSAVAFSPDGKYLASASYDKTVKLWDTTSHKEIRTLDGQASLVLAAAISPDSKLVASVGSSGNIMVWDAINGRHLHTFRAEITLVTSVAFNHDGSRLAVGNLDKTVRLFDLVTGQEAITLRGHTDMVMSVTFSPDGQQLASASMDGTVKVWDAEAGGTKSNPENRTLRSQAGAVSRMAFSLDGKRLATANYDETVTIWDMASGRQDRVLIGHSGPVFAVAFADEGRRLASADLAGNIKVWDAGTGKEVRSFTSFGGNMALSADGKRLAAGFEGATVFVWDVASGKEELSFHAHDAPILHTAISPDGRRLATSSWDTTVKVWDAMKGRKIHELRGHSHIVAAVVFSLDSKRLASANWDKTAKVWDTETGKELFTLKGHTDRVLSVAFSPDGKLLATASLDNNVKIWEAATGTELDNLREHMGWVFDVAFSPDGKWLAAAGGHRGKGEVKLWDTAKWMEKPDGR